MREASIILKKELRDAVQGRWLLFFGGSFAALALTLALVDQQAGSAGAQGFNRTTAGLINLCLLIVPLLALILGAGAIAGERERGTLVGLLSQPISATELLIGKFFGLLFAIWMALALGFGVAALLVSAFNPLTDAGYYLLFVLLSAALAAAMLSVGVFISVVSGSRVKALALSVAVWFVFVLFYDLGAIALAMAVTSSGKSLLLTVLINPVESVRILAILRLESDPQILGPLGAYVSNELGTGTSLVLLVGSLLAWVTLPLAAATRVFARQDA
jgi:Cu-processing system permease protein